MAAGSTIEREFLIGGTMLGGVSLAVLLALVLTVDGPVDPDSVEPAKIEVITVQAPAPEVPAPAPLPKVRPAKVEAPAPQPVPPDQPAFKEAAPAVAPVEGEPVVKGRVHTENDSGIEGASVQVLRGRRRLADGVTDSNGEFAVGPVSPGHIRVVVTHPEYAEVTKRYPHVPDKPIDVVLEPGGSLSGKVVDATSGEPIFRAAVRVGKGNGDNPRAMRRLLDRGTRTDKDGSFTFQGLPPGQVSIAASAAGYAVSEARTVDVEPGANVTDLILRLDKEAIIEGRVVNDEDGEPIARALVVFRPPYPAGARRARTTTDGRFRLKGVSPGTVSIEVSRTGYVTRWVSGLNLSPGEVLKDLEVRLQRPGGSLEGSSPYHDAPKIQYAGIGARLAPTSGGVKIHSVFPGSPAAEAGLQSGDVIVEVDGKPIDGKRLREVVEMIKGQEGQLVNLLVRHSDGTTSLVQPVRRLLNL